MLIRQWISGGQKEIFSYNAFVRHHGAESDFRNRSEKLWLLPWDHVCFVIFEGDSIQYTSNRYINFVYLLSFLKQLFKPPSFL